MKIKGLLIGFIVCVGLVPVFSSPSVKGPTGLIMMPTAEIIPFQKLEMASDYDLSEEKLEVRQLRYPNRDYKELFSRSSYKINMGAFKNFELGVVGGTQPDEGMFLNTKYLLMLDTRDPYPLSLSIGTLDVGSKENASAYLVLSKPFEKEAFSTLALYGRMNFHIGFKGMLHDKFESGIMVGLEYYPVDSLKLMTEFIEERYHSYWNAGIEFTLFEYVGLRFSALDMSNNRFSRFNAGVSLNFFM